MGGGPTTGKQRRAVHQLSGGKVTIDIVPADADLTQILVLGLGLFWVPNEHKH